MAGRPPIGVGELGHISTEVLPDGRVTARARTRDAGGNSRRLRAVASTEQLAVEKLRRTAAELGLRIDSMGAGTPLAVLFDSWLQDCSALRWGTRRVYADTVRWFSPMVGAITIGELTTLKAKRILEHVEREVSPAAVARARTALAGAIAAAIEAEAIHVNPLVGLRRQKRERSTPIALTVEQLVVIYEALDRRAERLAKYAHATPRSPSRVLDVLMGSGLRISEALALRHADVDLDEGVIVLTGTLVDDANGRVVRQERLKKDHQERRVKLPAFAVKALADAKRDCLTVQSRLEHAPALPSRAGTWISPRNFRRILRDVRSEPDVVEALGRTGVDARRLTPHTFRRTVATLISLEDGDLVRASAVLGHRDQKTTRESYVGTAFRVVGAADTLEDLIGDRRGGARRSDPS